MLKADVRERIERDIAAGRIQEVRKRLHRLVRDHPDDLALRRTLGDVYAALGDTVLAGKFWYFVEDKTDAMLDACAAFERSCGMRPATIVKRLEYQGDPDAVACKRAREMLSALDLKRTADERWGRLAAYGCGGLLLILLILGIAAFIYIIIVMQSIPLD